MSNPPASYYDNAVTFIKNRTTAFTRKDLEAALNISQNQASTALAKLAGEGRVIKHGGGRHITYTVGAPKAEKPKPEESKFPAQTSLNIMPPMSIEIENAIQSFTTAVVQAENLRAENERMKQALTQILTIASNALLK